MNYVSKNYYNFISEYMAFITALPPTDYASRLPSGYGTGCRTFDFWKIMECGDFKPDDSVLETGAWQTFFCLYLAQFVEWVDATDNFYWTTREFAKTVPSADAWMDTVRSLGKLVTATNIDLQDISYPGFYFDKVTCISTIEHVLDDHKAMSEMHRVLRPGGRLLLTTEYHETQGKDYDEADGSWYRVYNRQSWNNLLLPYKVLHQEVSTLPHEHWFTTAFAVIEK